MEFYKIISLALLGSFGGVAVIGSLLAIPGMIYENKKENNKNLEDMKK